jgi:hypothetical protein
VGNVKQLLKGKNHLNCGRVIEDQRDQFQNQESLTILKWLSDLNFWTKQDDAFERRQEGTGEWLLVDPNFQSWMKGDCNVLWCPGGRKPPPGLFDLLLI